MNLGLDGKVVVITGAGTPLGRASASAFAAEGCHLALTHPEPDRLAEAVALLGAAGSATLALTVDPADGPSMDGFIAAALDRFGRIDCAHNIPVAEPDTGRFHEQDEATFQRLLAAHARATFVGMRAEIRAMLRNGGGAIVNTSSSAGLVGAAGSAIASAVAHAVIGLTRTGALEFAGRGVRVNALCPPLHDDDIPLGAISVDDLAASAVWLCSRAAAAVTGTCLQADGGLVETEGQLGKH